MSYTPHKAMDIANWFLAFAQSEEYLIEHLKLQKLLYFAQSHYLADFGKSLFEDEIEAWVNGPAVRAVNSEVKAGMAEIVSLNTDFNFADFEPEINDFLIAVWNTYGHLHSIHLKNKTHKELPWLWYRDTATQYPSKIIPKTVMQNYYQLRKMAV